MSLKYKFQNPDALYFITFTVVLWVDVFSRRSYKDELLEILDYCSKNKGLAIHAYVIMSNHVHMIISRKNDQVLLSDIMRDLKKVSSYKLLKSIQENPQESRKQWMLQIFHESAQPNNKNIKCKFWQAENHPVELPPHTDRFAQRLHYIHNNPVKAGWVEEPTAYLYSSAADYQGKPGLLKIDILDH